VPRTAATAKGFFRQVRDIIAVAVRLVEGSRHRIATFISPFRLLVVSTVVAVLASFIVGVLWFSATGNPYSLRQLATASAVAFAFLFWIVWLVLRRSLPAVPPRRLVADWRRYILPAAVLISLGYAWSGAPIYRLPVRRYQVEIVAPRGASGEICVLGLGQIQGTLAGRQDEAISGIEPGDGWTQTSHGCWLYFQGIGPGTVTFSYVGPMDTMPVMFGPVKNDIEPQLHIDGRVPHGIKIRGLASGATLRTIPLETSALVAWRYLLTLGWIAVAALMLMASTVLSHHAILPPQLRALIEAMRAHTWMALVPLAVLALFKFWPAQYPFSPDVAYYLSLAKSLFHGDGYVNPDLSPAIYRGPVFPILISFSYGVLGESFLSAVILERVFWLLTCLVAFLLGRRLFNLRAGFLAGLFVLTAGVIDGVYDYVWVDGILGCTILILQSLIWELFSRRSAPAWYVSLGVLAGIAYLMKSTVLFIIPLPLVTWALISKYRNRRVLAGVIVFGAIFGLFFFGWIGYVLHAGGSPDQAERDLRNGLSLVSYAGRSIVSLVAGQPISSGSADVAGALHSPVYILYHYYLQDIVSRDFAFPVIVPLAVLYTAYQGLLKKSAADAFLCLGLVLFASMIPAQVVANYGARQSLYLYLIVSVCLAAMLDRLLTPGVLSAATANTLFVMVATTVIMAQAAPDAPWLTSPLGHSSDAPAYFSDSRDTAAWIDKNVRPSEGILIEVRGSRILHILTGGDRQFQILNTCIGEKSFAPAKPCTSPYISIWIYNGITDPDEPRDTMWGISEPELLSTVRRLDIHYIIVTPRVYSLYYYLKVHPDFEEAADLGRDVVFRVKPPVHSIADYPDIKWETCVGNGTSEYLENLKEANPAAYRAKLEQQLGPWMGLSAQDVQSLEDWDGCKIPAAFPGSYHLSQQP
jgi:4-amino-4-deoxy-L-arabinose transferase-like glycosyltransferase